MYRQYCDLFVMDILHRVFAVNVLYSEICSIVNDKQKLRECAIIFKYICLYINKYIIHIYINK